MVDTYTAIAVAFFAIFAIFMPASFLLTSKLLRTKFRGNKVKNAPYESAERTIGNSRDIDNEYLGFFALFLPFEIVGILLLLWAITARLTDLGTNLLVLGLAITAMFLAGIGYILNSDKRA